MQPWLLLLLWCYHPLQTMHTNKEMELQAILIEHSINWRTIEWCYEYIECARKKLIAPFKMNLSLGRCQANASHYFLYRIPFFIQYKQMWAQNPKFNCTVFGQLLSDGKLSTYFLPQIQCYCNGVDFNGSFSKTGISRSLVWIYSTFSFALIQHSTSFFDSCQIFRLKLRNREISKIFFTQDSALKISSIGHEVRIGFRAYTKLGKQANKKRIKNKMDNSKLMHEKRSLEWAKVSDVAMESAASLWHGSMLFFFFIFRKAHRA